MIKIGFLVNPIAGMGGAVGLKGTDGEAYFEALRRGAKPVAPSIARTFAKALKEQIGEDIALGRIKIYSAPHVMGSDYLTEYMVPHTVIDVYVPTQTSRDDTIRCASRMLELGVDLIVFVGGDGTARDIAGVVGDRVPILGIPSGVKMYSGIFAASPNAAALIIKDFIENRAEVVEAEVADIDEEAFRRDELVVRLYYVVKTIHAQGLLVQSKDVTLGEEEAKKAIAQHFIDFVLEDDVLYLLGPGTTVKAIADALGIPKTVLGIDAVVGRKLIAKDVWGPKLLDIVRSYSKRKLVLTPIGGQGFLIGRGNKQLTPEVLRYFTKDDLIVVSTPQKLAKLRYLIVDTGDPELDHRFTGYHRVITGYMEETIVKIVSAYDVDELRK